MSRILITNSPKLIEGKLNREHDIMPFYTAKPTGGLWRVITDGSKRTVARDLSFDKTLELIQRLMECHERIYEAHIELRNIEAEYSKEVK